MMEKEKRVELKKLKVVKLNCVFCYKRINITDDDNEQLGNNGSSINQTDKLKICNKFYRQIHQPLNYFKNKSKGNDADDNGDTDSWSQQITSLWDSKKNGICSDCFFAVHAYTQAFEKMEHFQRKQHRHLDTLYYALKQGRKIEHGVNDLSRNLEGSENNNSVVDFREKVYQTCRLKRLGINEFTKKDLSKNNCSSNQESNVQIGDSNSTWSLTKESGENNANFNFDDEPVQLFDLIPLPIKRRKGRMKKGQLDSEPAADQMSPPVNTTKSASDLPMADKCSNVFPLLEELASYEKENHCFLKDKGGDTENKPCDTKNASDYGQQQAKQGECTAESAHGTQQEPMELAKDLEASQPDDQRQASDDDYNICPDSDPDVCRNWPALKTIIQSLKPHGPLNLQQEELSTLPAPSSSSFLPSVCARKPKPMPMTPSAIISIAKNGDGEMEEELLPISKTTSMEKEKKRDFASSKCSRGKRRKCSMVCDICGKCFTASTLTKLETLMFQHLKENGLHGGLGTWKHCCSLCNKLFRYENGLQYHILKVHIQETDDELFSCVHCRIKFSRKEELSTHFTKTHDDHIITAEIIENADKMNFGSYENAMRSFSKACGDSRGAAVMTQGYGNVDNAVVGEVTPFQLLDAIVVAHA